MSRRSSRRTPRQSIVRQAGRDVVKHTPIARVRTLPRLKTIDLRVFEDRRAFHPDIVRPAFALPRSASRLVVHPNVNKPRPVPYSLGPTLRGSIPHRIGFEVPRQVVLCVRRQRRREIMHALGVAGRGGVGRGRKRRTNEYSEVGC